MDAKQTIAEAKAMDLSPIDVLNENPWIQSGRQCVEICASDPSRCRQPVHGASKWCYYHGKKERGLIG